jgi:hypothetical protein
MREIRRMHESNDRRSTSRPGGLNIEKQTNIRRLMCAKDIVDERLDFLS